jgi:hypothetical protein
VSCACCTSCAAQGEAEAVRDPHLAGDFLEHASIDGAGAIKSGSELCAMDKTRRGIPGWPFLIPRGRKRAGGRYEE